MSGSPPHRPLPPELRDVEIDTRPLALVLLSSSGRLFMLVAGALIFLLLLHATPPPGLGAAGQRSLAVFAICVIYWVTGALPLMITGLLAVVLLGLCGAMPLNVAYSLFGSEGVFFILAAFMLAAAVNYRGLGRRVSVGIFARFGHSPRSLLRSVMLLSALMSFVIPEHAVAAIVFPIVLDVIDSLDAPVRATRYPTALCLAMAWGTNIGGVATLLGGARNPLALSMLQEATGHSISFLRWSAATLPVVVILLAIGYAVLVAFFADEPMDIDSSLEAIRRDRSELGRITFAEGAVAAVLAVTIAAWSLASPRTGLASIAILAVVALFALNLLSWQEVERHINWGIILLYGGAIAMGSALQRSGAAAWVAMRAARASASPRVILSMLSLASLLLGETLSHTAVVASMLPVGLGLAHKFHLSERALTLAITIPAGLTFILPVSTPANALAFSSGYLRTRDLLIPGAILIVSSWIVLNSVIYLYWPLIGLSPLAFQP